MTASVPSLIDMQAAIVRSPLVGSPDTLVRDAIAPMTALHAPAPGTSAPRIPRCDLHREARASCLLVMEAGQVLGLLTERDVVRLSAQPQLLATLRLRDVMTPPLVILRQHDLTQPTALTTLLQQLPLPPLPVLDQADQLVGIVTQTSLLQALNPAALASQFQALEQRISELEGAQQELQAAYTTQLERQVEQRTAELKTRIEREQVMARIAARIAASLYLPEILKATVQELRSFLECDRMLILQFQAESQSVAVAEAVGAGWQTALHHTFDDPCFQSHLALKEATGQAIAVSNIHRAGYSDCYLQSLEAYQVKANLVVPIRVSGQLWGLLVGHQCATYRVWEDSDLTLLTEMTVQLAIAIQQANAYQQVQTELLERQRSEAERQHMEAALRESEERFRMFMEHSPTAAWISDANCRLLYASPTYRKIFLVPPVLIGKTVFDLYPEDIAQVYLENIQTVVRTRQVIECIEPGLHPDGSRGEFWVFKFPMPHASGRVDVGGVAIDITSRKAAEDALRDSEERLRLALMATNQGLYDLNLQTGEAIVSPEYATLLGFDPATFEESNARWIERLHPEDREATIETFRSYLAGELPEYKVEFRQRTCTGAWKWILSLGRVVAWDGAGHPLRMLGTHTDISDRKQAEADRLQAEALRLELTLLETLLDSVLAGYWDWDLRNQRQYLSPGFRRMLGYPAAAVPNSPETWQQLIFAEDLPEVLTCFNRHVQSQGLVPFYSEVRYRHQDGSTVWAISSGKVIEWDPTGQPLRMIGCHIDISARKQAEETITQYSREVEDLYNKAPCGYHSLDGEGRFITVNDTELQWLGYRRQELLDKSFADILTEASLRTFQENYPRFKQRGWVQDLEFDLVCKDGTLFPVFLSAVAVKDEAGNYLYSRSTLFDARDRKQAEERLRKSDAHLKVAQRIGKLGSWEFDIRLGQISWSDEVFRIFGRDPAAGPPSFEELQQQIYVDDRDSHRQVVQTAIETAQPYEIEYRLYHPSGNLRHIQARGEVIVDAAGQPIQLVGTVLNITERKQAEAQLRSLTDRLALALESGAMGTWDWDIRQNRLIWDDRMYQLYGITPEQFPQIYDGWASRLHPDDRSLAEGAIQQALRGEKAYDPEFRVVHPDGTVHFIKAYALVQRNAQGEPQRMIGINFEVTELKQAEIKLLQTSAQLAASNRELEAFAYSVSHDLRAPLRAIDGFSKALLEDYGEQFEAEGQDYFTRIRSNVNRMGMLIDDLLRLSRVSRSEMKYSLVNLSALFQEQITELQLSEPERQVSVVIAPQIIVTADATLMRVVISNLVQNAWKFTSHHTTARIEFGISQPGRPPTYFVRDDGAGFDMAYVNMLFGVFQRLHNMNEFPGTGIGLATVQRAIHRHGGQVWAEGVVEQGATFYFTVPLSLSGQELTHDSPAGNPIG